MASLPSRPYVAHGSTAKNARQAGLIVYFGCKFYAQFRGLNKKWPVVEITTGLKSLRGDIIERRLAPV
jgi:hypothetical protein